MWGTGTGWQEGGQEWEAGAPLGRATGQHLLRLHVPFPEAQHTLPQDRVTQLNGGHVLGTARSSILYESKQKLAICRSGYRQGTG